MNGKCSRQMAYYQLITPIRVRTSNAVNNAVDVTVMLMKSWAAVSEPAN